MYQILLKRIGLDNQELLVSFAYLCGNSISAAFQIQLVNFSVAHVDSGINIHVPKLLMSSTMLSQLQVVNHMEENCWLI